MSAVIDHAPIRAALSTPVVILPLSSAPIFAEVIAASAIIAVLMNPLEIVILSEVIDPAAIRAADRVPVVIFDAGRLVIYASVIAALAIIAVAHPVIDPKRAGECF